ncbi:MAG: T9SS type A sorting domain-containing protein [Psychroserpens sp.]|uniref:T9SS type A sorting domain-containing protein n=1 Tax=Psychroserpens sp. TaxID=2020870 RepID=UPI003001E133
MKLRTLLLFIIFTKLAFGQSFIELPLLDDVSPREADWGDFDNDGDLDILIFYTDDDNHNGSKQCRILENTTSGFIILDVGFPVIENSGSNRYSSAKWIDYDNDGDLDVYFTRSPMFGGNKLFKNNPDNSFTEVVTPITTLETGSVPPSWGDYDNDGDLDLLYFGRENSTTWKLKIYNNDIATNSFTDSNLDFGDTFIKSTESWGDFNNDGYVDIMVFKPTTDNLAYTNSNLAILKNNGNGSFTELIFNNIDGLFGGYISAYTNQNGDAKWGDFDNDGYLDILITGKNESSSASALTSLYKNNGDETFTEINIDNVYDLSGEVYIELGDFDNNGYLDIVQTGRNEVDGVLDRTRIFLNTNGVFTDLENETFLRNIQAGMVTIADYNNDNLLDFLVLGEFDFSHRRVSLYENLGGGVVNTAPQIPTNLNTQFLNNELIFSWNSSTDAETQSNGLSYNISIIKGNDILVSSNSLANGKRTIVGIGNAYQNQFFKIVDPEPGIYKWRVQTIDTGYLESLFTAEQTYELDALSVVDLQLEELNIYPNPTDNLINIQSKTLIDIISIYDINGRLLQINQPSNSSLEYQLDVSHLSQGIYFLEMQSNNLKQTQKFIKK